MWLLGLLIGAGFGAAFGHVFQGAVLGLALGILAGKKEPVAREPRILALEKRLETLERHYAALQARLRSLEGGEPAESGRGVAESVAEEPASAPPTARETGAEPVSPPARPAPAVPESVPLGGTGPDALLQFPPGWDEPDDGEEAPLSVLWRRLLSGNMLAKIGVALLFLGVASALKLAAEHGWFPPGLRLLLGAAAGGAMVGFGWSRREDPAHRAFALVLQGGGFGLLYLMAYFALTWYGLIGQGFAFVLFSLLGVGCTSLAVREDGPMLAVFGLAGAFLAPILASSGEGSHLVLFSYDLLLNGFILGVAWFKDWRPLTATGFLFTFVVGLSWAEAGYRPEQYLGTQIFLVLFFLLYSATPVVFALLRAPGRGAWHEALLLFGTPVATMVLQAPLVAEFEHGQAWSAFLAGIYYLGLWRAVAGRSGDEFELLRAVNFGAGAGLLTLAVPLAFGAAATVAIWSVEGAASLWLALRLGRPLGQWFGVLAQAGAGAWLLLHLPELADPRPWVNGLFTGGMLVALSGLASAAMLRAKDTGGRGPAAELLLTWGLCWWYGTGLHEIREFVRPGSRAGLGLLLFVATGALGETLGRRYEWTAPRLAERLILPAAAVAVLFGLDGGAFLSRGVMALALPLAFAVHYWALARREADGVDNGGWAALIHPGAAWLLTFVLTHDAYDLADRWAGGPWRTLALGLPPAALLALGSRGVNRGAWPFDGHREVYVIGYLLPMVLLLAAWFAWASFHEPGGLFAVYLPLVDPFDAGLIAVLLAIRHSGRIETEALAWTPKLMLSLVLAGVSGLAVRLAHHWGGVPFAAGALLSSALAQALLSIFWTLLAIGLMIQAVKTRRRQRWFAGFALLAVVGVKLLFVDLAHSGTGTWTASLIGIALLVLAAGYFAPVPPNEG